MPSIITDQPVVSQTEPKAEEVKETFAAPVQTQDLPSFSSAELSDPGAISVTVADKTTPIVVLFGPPASGKTMTLVRMTRFLQNQGYTIEPVRTFRPAHDVNYKDICDKFNRMVYSEWAAELTRGLNFMLIKVSKRSKPICQILEAPGEHYFDPTDEKEPRKTFVSYIENIINSPNKKIWINIVEPDWKDESDRMKFVKKIALLKSKIHKNDKSIFLFNKIDITEFVYGQGDVYMGPARKYVADNYPGIFLPFKNPSPITSLWRPYNCRFVPFVTGSYNEMKVAGEDRVKYEEGTDIYPRRLWTEIGKYL